MTGIAVATSTLRRRLLRHRRARPAIDNSARMSRMARRHFDIIRLN
jgi:hypothetical protein